jgi:hypothetical protein
VKGPSKGFRVKGREKRKEKNALDRRAVVPRGFASLKRGIEAIKELNWINLDPIGLQRTRILLSPSPSSLMYAI